MGPVIRAWIECVGLTYWTERRQLERKRIGRGMMSPISMAGWPYLICFSMRAALELVVCLSLYVIMSTEYGVLCILDMEKLTFSLSKYFASQEIREKSLRSNWYLIACKYLPIEQQG